MAGKELLSREDLLKENLNNIKIDTKDAKKFLIYFGAILKLGQNEGLIDEAGFNFIANAITNAIEAKTDDDEYDSNYVQIRNYMYIVSSYLQSKSIWDAWVELSCIKTNEDAFLLIDNAKDWFDKKMMYITDSLKTIKLSIVKVKMSNVTDTYQALLSITKKAVSATSEITQFDLVTYHNTPLNITTYVFIRDYNLQDSKNFFDELSGMIYYFNMEVSILSNINVKELVKGKKRESNEFFNNYIRQVEEIDRMYEKKLLDLKKDYNKKLKKRDDVIELERKYSDDKYNVEKEWEEKVKLLEEFFEKEETLQFEIIGGEYSLYDLIKEYAIYSLALKEKIVYPSTPKERSSILAMIDIKLAISEFIEVNHQLLTSEQIEFLKQIACE